jgi:hypothetical protein
MFRTYRLPPEDKALGGPMSAGAIIRKANMSLANSTVWLLFTVLFIFRIDLAIIVCILCYCISFFYANEKIKKYDWLMPEISSLVCFAYLGLADSGVKGINFFGENIFLKFETRKILFCLAVISTIPNLIFYKYKAFRIDHQYDKDCEELRKLREVKRPQESYLLWANALAYDLFSRLGVNFDGHHRLTLYFLKENGQKDWVTLGRYSTDPTYNQANRKKLKHEGILKDIHSNRNVRSYDVPGGFWAKVDGLSSRKISRFKKEFSNQIPLPDDIMTLKNFRMKSLFYCGAPLVFNKAIVGLMIYESDQRPDAHLKTQIVDKVKSISQDPYIQVFEIVLANWYNFYDPELTRDETA